MSSVHFFFFFFLEIFLDFLRCHVVTTIQCRVITIEKKFRIIKNNLETSKLWTKSIFVSKKVSEWRGKKKKEGKEKEEEDTAKSIDSLYFPDCRHLRVHARACFRTVATTIIDERAMETVNYEYCMRREEGARSVRFGKFATIQRLEHTSSDRLSPSYASLGFVIEDVI